MPDCSNLKPGDRCMIVQRTGWKSHIYLTQTTVDKVYKNGFIITKCSDQRYRPNGSVTGSGSGTLQPWSEDLLKEYREEQAMLRMANSVHRMSKAMNKYSGDLKRSKEIFEAVTPELRALLGEEE